MVYFTLFADFFQLFFPLFFSPSSPSPPSDVMIQIKQFTSEFEIIFLAMCTDAQKIHAMLQLQSEEAAQKVKNSGVLVWESHYMEDDKAYTTLMEVCSSI